MVNRYLKLETREADIIKNQFFLCENGFSNIQRIIENYKISRKKEIIIKNKLKLSISSLKAKLNALENTFPEDERKESFEDYYRKKQTKKHNEKTRHSPEKHFENKEENIDPYEDLENIKTQLSRFN